MVKQQRSQRIPVGLVAAIAGVAIATGGGAAWWHWHSAHQTTPPPPVSTTEQSPSSPVTPQVQTAQVFWLKDTGSKQ